jgi:hypothetical protein
MEPIEHHAPFAPPEMAAVQSRSGRQSLNSLSTPTIDKSKIHSAVRQGPLGEA